MKKTYSIEANIGGGKSELLREIQKEFITYTQCFVNSKILKEFYSKENDNDFKLQKFIFQSYEKQWNQSKDEDSTVFFEGILSSHNVFSYISKENNRLSNEDFDELDNNYSPKSIQMNPDYVVFLNTSPENCYERIKRRNRGNEVEGINLEYLKQIDKRYREYLSELDNVIIIDTYENDRELTTKELFSKIKEKIFN